MNETTSDRKMVDLGVVHVVDGENMVFYNAQGGVVLDTNKVTINDLVSLGGGRVMMDRYDGAEFLGLQRHYIAVEAELDEGVSIEDVELPLDFSIG